MRKITSYTLIKADFDESFRDKVNELLDEGWELYGDPIIANEISDKGLTTIYAQALVTYNDLKEPDS